MRRMMDKSKEKEIEELIKEDIEKETRVEMKPVPPSQLDRIERMLKYQIVEEILKSKDDFIERMSKDAKASWDTELIELLKERRDKIVDQLPDISDIIKEVK